MLTVQQIPGAWTAALKMIQAIAPEAVIGGGCLRDLDHGVDEIKDIDIFVNGRRECELYSLRDRLIAGGVVCSDIDSSKMYPIGECNDVVGYFDVVKKSVGYPVQVIMVNADIGHVTERFDYGICRIVFDSESLIISDDYISDSADKVFRLCVERDGVGLASSVHRYARLVRKYPGWHFVPFSMDDMS